MKITLELYGYMFEAELTEDEEKKRKNNTLNVVDVLQRVEREKNI